MFKYLPYVTIAKALILTVFSPHFFLLLYFYIAYTFLCSIEFHIFRFDAPITLTHTNTQPCPSASRLSPANRGCCTRYQLTGCELYDGIASASAYMDIRTHNTIIDCSILLLFEAIKYGINYHILIFNKTGKWMR